MEQNDQAQTTSPTETTQEVPPKHIEHPIVIAVQRLLHRVRDIEDCGLTYPQLARDREAKQLGTLANDLEVLIEGSLDPKDPGHGSAVKRLLDASRGVHRIMSSNQAETLLTSLFLGAFSSFDGFTGNLIGALFERKPELFFKLGRTVPVVDVLKAPSIEAFKQTVLDEYVESFRRQSYIDQFDALERLFDISLKKFDNWPKFVEASQRRNLVAHCNGVVSEQYLTICRREQVPIGNETTTGTQLTADKDYLIQVCLLIKEVAVKLAQTLWRKSLPEEIEEADTHLIKVGYDALQAESWEWAQVIGEFATSQKRMGTEKDRLISLVNLLIALKFGGKTKEMLRLLASQDWSATSGEFRLAAAVLKGEFEESARIMHLIGLQGDFLNKTSYHDWPLFREFRSSREFLESYEKIYGHPFVVELEREAKAEVSMIEGVQEEARATETEVANSTDGEQLPIQPASVLRPDVNSGEGISQEEIDQSTPTSIIETGQIPLR